MLVCSCQFRCCARRVKLNVLLCLSIWPVDNADDCERYKHSCNENSICSDRLAFLFSSCSTGRCTEQCRRSVVELYELKDGKDLLDTDLSCLEFLSSEVMHCKLWPRGQSVYCNIAKQKCMWNSECRKVLTAFESQCQEAAKNGECSSECVKLMAKVFKGDGEKLYDCYCPHKDETCEQIRHNIGDSCRSKAWKQRNSGAFVKRQTSWSILIVLFAASLFLNTVA
ncbi:unnamed protein product [Soboliphyme baturini]|uniref:GDNF/GAS1 domain-containing protein n=1 Tax=Soboliphyme baturini TaxID=241478 RepID=A0A3P8FYF8_9BILA|nr:unnamed protein product [Soboliphyme baturini]